MPYVPHARTGRPRDAGLRPETGDERRPQRATKGRAVLRAVYFALPRVLHRQGVQGRVRLFAVITAVWENTDD